MQREIKFRAWIDDYQKYIIPSHLQECEGGTIHYFTDSERMGYYDLDNPKNALEQFTGLHDKNGKEIYEGDILDSVLYNCWEYPQVMYSNEKCAFGVMTGWDWEPLDFYYISQNIVDDSEVIGNIHENGDLLENT